MANVSTIMSQNPVSCRPETPLPEVAKLMLNHDCGQIPVVDENGCPIGVVTDRDIVVRVIAQIRDTTHVRAADAMTSPAYTILDNSDLKECICLMEDIQVRRVPVTDQSGKLVGMVSLADLALANKKTATAEVVREVSKPLIPIPNA